MIEWDTTYNGKKAISVLYLTPDMKPVDKKDASMVRVNYADGTSTFEFISNGAVGRK